MNDIFDKSGNLTDLGEKLTANFQHSLQELMNSLEISQVPENQLCQVGDFLSKILSEAIFKKKVEKQQLTNQINTMNDEDFLAYLKNKYGAYGNLYKPLQLSFEEYTRYIKILANQIKEIQAHNNNFYPTHGLNIHDSELYYK